LILLKKLVVKEGHFVEELVSIDSKLVNDFLDDWLNLHVGINSTTNLLVD